MWCINCGKKLPDEAKFCFACGAKVVEEISSNVVESPTMSESSKNATVSSVVTYNILGHEISLDSRILDYAKLRHHFQKKAKEQADSFFSFFQEKIDNIDDVVSMAFPKIFMEIKNSVNYGVRVLMSYDVNHIESSALYELSYDLINPENYLQPYIESMAKIESFVNEIAEKRANDKACRSYWSGGGFGVKGAIKGALTAEVMNVGMNALYGIEDMFQDAKDKKLILQAKEDAFNDEIIVALTECVEKCCFNVFFAVLKILAEENKVSFLSIETKGHEEATLNNYLKMHMQGYMDDNGKIEEQIVKCLSKNPFNFKVYKLWTEWFMEEWTCDAISELVNFADALYIKEEVFLQVRHNFNEYYEDILSDLQEDPSLDLVEEYLEEIERYSLVFSFVDFDAPQSYLTELKLKLLGQKEKENKFAEAYFPISSFEENIEKFIRYSMENCYDGIWEEIEKQNGLFEYFVERSFCDVYCKKWIEDHSMNAINNLAEKLKSIKSPKTNFYKYLAIRLIYEAEKNYLWGKDGEQRATCDLLSCSDDKNACVSAILYVYYHFNKDVRLKRKNYLEYAVKHGHPGAMATMGAALANAEWGFQQDEGMGRIFISLSAAVKNKYAMELAEQYEVSVPDYEIPIPLQDIVDSLEGMRQMHKQDLESKHYYEDIAQEDTLATSSIDENNQAEETTTDSPTDEWMVINDAGEVELNYIPKQIFDRFKELLVSESYSSAKVITNMGSCLEETKQIKKVLEKLGVPENESVYLLADATVFMNFTKGFAICKKAFRFVDSTKDCGWVSWGKITDWAVQADSFLYIGGYGFNILYCKAYEYLFNEIQTKIKHICGL